MAHPGLHPIRRCSRLSTFLRNSFDHAVLVVHTHSDDESGDLWYTPRCTGRRPEDRVPLATPIESVSIPSYPILNGTDASVQFFDTVIGPTMIEYLQGMKFSAFFLLACGAVVRVNEAREALKRVTVR